MSFRLIYYCYHLLKAKVAVATCFRAEVLVHILHSAASQNVSHLHNKLC